MLSLDDEHWAELSAGCRLPVDLRSLLKSLQAAEDPEPVWRELWQELHHQGDVGEGSFAAVPHLVRIHRERGVVDWNTYALVATIELARDRGGNPDVPEWARESYEESLRELGALALVELPRAPEHVAVRSILAILAIVHGAETYGRLLLEFSEEEVTELERQANDRTEWGSGF
jgi:hypothetical protein